jgi:hypothetical protein
LQQRYIGGPPHLVLVEQVVRQGVPDLAGRSRILSTDMPWRRSWSLVRQLDALNRYWFAKDHEL